MEVRASGHRFRKARLHTGVALFVAESVLLAFLLKDLRAALWEGTAALSTDAVIAL